MVLEDLQMIGLSFTYLTGKNLFSINDHDSNLAPVLYGVLQGSVLGPLLLLNQAMKFCKVHHFTDDTNLLHFSKSITRLNKYVNLDMKNLMIG